MKIMKWEQYLQRLLKYHVSIKPVFFVQINKEVVLIQVESMSNKEASRLYEELLLCV